MNQMNIELFTYISVGVIFVLIIIIIADYFNNPFRLPHIIHDIDISGRKKPRYHEYIEDWLLHQYNHRKDILHEFNNTLRDWDDNCKKIITKSLFWKKHKENQYYDLRQEVADKNYKMFIFRFYRTHIRYRQQNYNRYAYQVNDIDNTVGKSLSDLLGADYDLEEIGYETTLRKHEAKKQRDLMTPSLRKKIMKRDHYTCRYCGKYMPNGDDIHIDHIIPIAKGGKTIESNLQVLCQKCNLQKGAK